MERALVLTPGWAGLACGSVSTAEAAATAAGTANDACVKPPPLSPLLLLLSAMARPDAPCNKGDVGCGGLGSPLVIAGAGPPDEAFALLLLLLSSPDAAAKRKN